MKNSVRAHRMSKVTSQLVRFQTLKKKKKKVTFFYHINISQLV